MHNFVLALSVTATLGLAANPPGLTISNEMAPPGGWAQIKLYADKPAAIVSGHLVLTLDSKVFGTGAKVGLFGTNADAIGLALTTGTQIDVRFSSATSGIGQLPGLPVMVVSVPVLASAAGQTVTISATSPDSSVTVANGSVTVRGTLSVQKIEAGMGVVGAGTIVPVYGSGFTAATAVAIDGVMIASNKFVSASEIDVTLGGAAELVGKRVRVTDGGVEFDYFCFQPGDSVNFPGDSQFASNVANIQPMFPLFAGTSGSLNNTTIGGVVEIQNPNPKAATVSVADIAISSMYAPETQRVLSIPPGGWTIFEGDPHTQFEMTSDLPVRVVGLLVCDLGTTYTFCPAPLLPSDFLAPGNAPMVLSPPALLFGWQAGSAAPPAAQKISEADGAIKATTVTAGAAWLLATVTSNALTVSVNPGQLAVGTYQGSIVVTQVYGPASTVPVTLSVTTAPVPTILAAPSSLTFTAPSTTAAPYSQTIAIDSNSGPAPFTVTPSAGGGTPTCCYAWLKVSPTSGTTPATVTVTWDPAATSQIPYYQPLTNGSILIAGPANSITIPATFNVTGVQTYQTSQGAGGNGPNGVVFSAQTGTATQTQKVFVYPLGTMTLAVDQPWITAAVAVNTGLAQGEVDVTVNPSGLAPGTYTGTVTIGEAGLAFMVVPVTLGVWKTPPKLTITQGNFTFVETVGEALPPYQTTEIDSGGVPVPLTFLTGGTWLNLINRFTLTPAPLLVGVTGNASVPPGTLGQFDGSFTVTSPDSSVYAGVTLLIEPGPVTPPVVSQAVNSASGIAGGVSPGEILTIRGYGVGAAAISGVKLDPSGSVAAQLNGVRVMFDGRPAPLIYTSAYQTNLIVPYEVAGKASTVMQVTYEAAMGTLQTAAWTLPVVTAAPGVFTIDATGTGQGAIVNQDGTVNSAVNPAPVGSVVSIYATGEGQTSPVGVTGSVTQTNLKKPLLPVTVTIGAADAVVQYAGSASSSVAGLLQVNAVVPPGIAPNVAAPVSISVGGIHSQSGVTIAVK